MVSFIVHCIDKPLFSSAVLIDFMYVVIILISEHAKKGTPWVKGGRGR